MKKGYALITVLLFIIVFAVLGMALLSMAQLNVRHAAMVSQMDQSYYAAESAVHIAAQELQGRIRENMNGKLASSEVLNKPYVFDGETEEELKAKARERLKEIEKIITDVILKSCGELESEAEYNGLQTILVPVNKDEISFGSGKDAGEAVYFDADGGLHMNFEPPSFTLAAKSGARTVSVEVDLDFDGFFSLKQHNKAVELIDKSLSAGGAAYYDDDDAGSLYGNQSFIGEQEYVSRFGLRFAVPPELPNPTAVPPVYASAKQAEYYRIKNAMENMFDKYTMDSNDKWETLFKEMLGSPDEGNAPYDYSGLYTGRKSFYNSLDYTETVRRGEIPFPGGVRRVKAQASGMFGGGFSITGNKDLDGESDPAVFPDLEYLYVDGDLTITGCVSFPNLKGLYVEGKLIMGSERRDSNSVSFAGAENGVTKIHANGEIEIYTRGKGKDITNAQLSGDKKMIVGTSSNGSFSSNAVFISSFENAGGSGGTGLSIVAQQLGEFGGTEMAPQFYSRTNLSLFANTRYYGIYATVSDEPFAYDYYVERNITGLVIGNFSDYSRIPPANTPHGTIDSGALLPSPFVSYLNRELDPNYTEGSEYSEGGYELEIKYPTPEPGSVPDVLRVSELKSLRETKD